MNLRIEWALKCLWRRAGEIEELEIGCPVRRTRLLEVGRSIREVLWLEGMVKR